MKAAAALAALVAATVAAALLLRWQLSVPIIVAVDVAVAAELLRRRGRGGK